MHLIKIDALDDWLAASKEGLIIDKVRVTYLQQVVGHVMELLLSQALLRLLELCFDAR